MISLASILIWQLAALNALFIAGTASTMSSLVGFNKLNFCTLLKILALSGDDFVSILPFKLDCKKLSNGLLWV